MRAVKVGYAMWIPSNAFISLSRVHLSLTLFPIHSMERSKYLFMQKCRLILET